MHRGRSLGCYSLKSLVSQLYTRYVFFAITKMRIIGIRDLHGTTDREIPEVTAVESQ